MKRALIFAALYVAACGAAAAQRSGPACDYGTAPCEAYAQADAVFRGTVTRIVPATYRREWTDADYDQTAYVSVEKVYKGYRGRRVVLRQLGRRGGQKFVQGTTYLFFANYDRAGRFWEVRPCGRTVMAQYAQLDLRYIEGLPATAGRTRAAGKVMVFDPDPSAERAGSEALAGVRVKLAGVGREFETATDASGIFEFTGLPPGRYRIEARVPNTLIFFGAIHTGPDPVGRARELEFDLEERGCAEVTLLYTEGRKLRKEGGRQVGRAASPLKP